MRHLISLGQRCDVAFQLRCHSGNNVAHFFDWLVSPLDSIIKTFDLDFDVFSPDHLHLRNSGTHNHVHDSLHGFTFHHQFPTIGVDATGDYLLFYPAFTAKFQHLANRFRDYAQHRPITLIRRNIDKAGAERLEAAFFARFPGADAQFIYVTHAEHFATEQGRCVSLPPPKTGLGDVSTWAQMLVAEGLVETPYRLSAEEVLGRDEDDHALSGGERFSEEQLQDAVATNPGNIFFRLDLSRILGRKGRWSEAAEVLRCIPAEAVTPDVVIGSAWAKWKAGVCSLGAATAEVAACPEVGTASLRARLDGIDLLMASGDHQSALQVCKDTLDLNAVLHTVYLRKANCLSRLRQQVLALSAINAAIRLSPRMASYYQVKAAILSGINRLPEAIEAQENAVRLAGGHNMYHAFGNLLLRAGRKSEAIEAYRSALSAGDEPNPSLAEKIQELENEVAPRLAFAEAVGMDAEAGSA